LSCNYKIFYTGDDINIMNFAGLSSEAQGAKTEEK